jgi:aspartyl protease family protein
LRMIVAATRIAADPMRTIIIFAIAALLLAGMAPRYLEKAGAPVQPASGAATPAQPAARAAALPQPVRASVSAGPRSIVLSPNAYGHFKVEGTVDGRHLEFMVDTGASYVALRARDAARLGIHPAQRDYTGRSNTANGIARFAPVKLDMVEIGGVTVRNVQAVVMADEGLGENLLGMSFLSRLRRYEYREGRMVLEE